MNFPNLNLLSWRFPSTFIPSQYFSSNTCTILVIVQEIFYYLVCTFPQLSWYFPVTFHLLSQYFQDTFHVLLLYFPGTLHVLSLYFPSTFLVVALYFLFTFLVISRYCPGVFNRPGVAGAVLQTHSSLIH